MNKRDILVAIVVLLVGAGGGFYAGLKYQQSKTPAAGQFGARNFQNLTSEQRQQMGEGQVMFRDMTGGQTGGGIAAGKIISRDENSITVELRDGGSKIVFLSAATTISKSATGTPEDLAQGQEVMVAGSANSDGTLTAQKINLTPNLPTRPE